MLIFFFLFFFANLYVSNLRYIHSETLIIDRVGVISEDSSQEVIASDLASRFTDNVGGNVEIQDFFVTRRLYAFSPVRNSNKTYGSNHEINSDSFIYLIHAINPEKKGILHVLFQVI